jgi:hypothetical protein
VISENINFVEKAFFGQNQLANKRNGKQKLGIAWAGMAMRAAPVYMNMCQWHQQMSRRRWEIVPLDVTDEHVRLKRVQS